MFHPQRESPVTGSVEKQTQNPHPTHLALQSLSSAAGFRLLFPNYFLWSKTHGGVHKWSAITSPAPSAGLPRCFRGRCRAWDGDGGGGTAAPPPPPPPPPRARLSFSGAGGEPVERVKGSVHRQPPAPLRATGPARPGPRHPPRTTLGRRSGGFPAAQPGRDPTGTVPSAAPLKRGWGGGRGSAPTRGGLRPRAGREGPLAPPPPAPHYLPRLRVALVRHDVTAAPPARAPSPAAHQRGRTTAA